MFQINVDGEIALKILGIEDAGSLFNLIENNRTYLHEWVPWVELNATVEDSKTFISTALEQHKENLGFHCGIWLKNKIIGVIGFQRIDWLNRSVEIGYWIDEKHQGHGIITKSCRMMVDYAFNEFKLHRVQIRCATKNNKSCAVIERLGFIKEGISRQAEFLYDHYVDLFVYGMIADEWKIRSNIDTGRNPS